MFLGSMPLQRGGAPIFQPIGGVGNYSVNLSLSGSFSVIGNYTDISEIYGTWGTVDDTLMEEKTFFFEVSTAGAFSIAASNGVNVLFKRPSLVFERIYNTVNETSV